MKKLLNRYFGKAWLAVTFLFLYLPLFFMLVFSFNNTRQDAVFTGFSLRWYEALTRDTKIVDGFWLSVQVATAAGVASAVLATFAAFVLVRYRRFAGRTLFSGMVNAPLVMPEVVIGLSLLLLMVGVQNALGWPQRGMLTIVLGHMLLGMAYGTVVVQSRLLEMDRAIEEAAMDLGAKPFQVFFLVTLPNILQAVLAAYLLAFTLSFDDVVIAEFLSGPGVNTLPQVIFGYARRGINPTIYAAATLLIASVTLVVITYSVWVARQTRKREREIAAATRAELLALQAQ
ncbi:binding-protein-dependent transport systems inner membrane component [Rhodoferax ferrireducens T118]|uniref:Binding-protein-dependent transport systems inner membrane component n=1 Tax=Albidiferax ferrireducens (strain ATCC BAA-621 / DSM 15236 / T118) TaxID=338969 RepID=Q222E4_ALBFT|nr:ABC transporter permease subunit [Rhodoferax ferrireducens]ABD68109.1 binding-protein-dependent transport systems inner membrane component [Rhodoferax ferrireducens T118]WPC67230.1 ABC transporter permease subunit [Rhodoferax ferrireducens]